MSQKELLLMLTQMSSQRILNTFNPNDPDLDWSRDLVLETKTNLKYWTFRGS